MIAKDALNKLKEFGLNSYEGRIWVALLTKGSSTAGSLSESANVPRSRCYDVLESLEKKGFIVAQMGRPLKYVAISPHDAIDRVKDQLRSETEEQIQNINSMKESALIKDLHNLHQKGNSELGGEQMTGLLKGKRNIHAHISTIVADAEEVLLSTTAEGISRKADLITSSINKGTTCRILSQGGDEYYLKSLRNCADVSTNGVGDRFIVTDKSALLFLTNESDSEEYAVWMSSSPVVSSLKDLFNSKWK